MSVRNRSCSSSILQACSSAFTRQPSRVLIVDASPPWWSEICSVLCQALENFFFIASSLAGPVRLPLLSIFAISAQLECLLPFVQVKGNLTRLLCCVEELRSLPQEGCIRQRGALLKQAVLDSLQQFKQYMCHTALGDINSNCVEVTVLTCQSGHMVLRQLEKDLKSFDLMSLRRLLVIHISLQQNLSDQSPTCSLEMTSSEDHNDHEESLMLGTEMDLQLVEGTVLAVENALKMWLHEQGGDREHLHLLLPPSLTAQGSTPNPANNKPGPVCLKCDMQERLLSPVLFPSTADLGVKTESMQDYQPPNKANQNLSPKRLQVVKVLHADGVCQSVLYGLPLVIRPTSCWQLDWDEIESNHQMFHALCHTLETRDWFLLVRSESSSGSGSCVFSYYILQSTDSLSLLLKPVLTRELMLPCTLLPSTEEPPLHALATVESSLEQLERDPVFNPLCLDTNFYLHLRMRGLLTRTSQQAGGHSQGRGLRRDASRPPEGSTQRQVRQSQSRVRATVAPLSSTPPNKIPRPSLTLSHSRPRGSAHFFQDYEEEDRLMVQRK
ncbi:meiosis 1 arrest protein [Triplophysa dalaica]|uniref:meiosis 1 arrest protein n=1 Tax=Triplophysa dalaica TaxID=1582913 RepID=UPI0024DF5915|nr:meiosis 1 arrest protein [Triplophysa dalaica]XP_056604931.1 meiosis 1 arrest protein [Triplophysa dalaica]XP_056605010.1 meiosis 1 arrest protein [Triplophysa dalaica]XP_056605079.1 meiosis 1 arrest protein [Triplophysa dalaica]